MHNYTIKELKKNLVTVSSDTIENDEIKIKTFSASFDNSSLGSIVFPIPDDVVKILGRLFQKNDHLELGYIVSEEIWFILQKDKLLWSNKFLKLKPEKEEKKPRYNRFTALIKDQ